MTTPLPPIERPDRCLRVGHSIVKAGSRLDELPARLEGAQWDMVELDVMALGDRLVVAHDDSELGRSGQVDFGEALGALADLLPEHVEFDVDVKAVGYEDRVADAVRGSGLAPRTLISTMESDSLAVLRRLAPELRLGLSVPKARRDYLAHPLTRPGAYLMLAYLRRALPGQVQRALRSGAADAIMAHWGVVTPHLVQVVRAAGGELYVWTVDDHRRLTQLAELGVTGVITNERDLFHRAGFGSL